MNRTKRLNTILIIDMIIGTLMMIPLISVLSGYPINSVFEEHLRPLKLVVYDIVIVVVCLGFITFKTSTFNNFEFIAPQLLLFGGMVPTVYFLSSYLGFHYWVTAFLAPMTPSIFSVFHVIKVNRLIETSQSCAPNISPHIQRSGLL